MKKIIIASLALLCSLSIDAQIVSSRTREITYTVDKPKPKSETVSYLQVGYVNSKLSGDGEGIKAKAGFEVLYGVEKPILGIEGLFYNYEVGAGNTRGFAVKHSDYSFSSLGVKVLPVGFGYKYPVTGDITIQAHVGIGVSYDITGTLKYDDDHSWNISDFDDLNMEYQRLDVYSKFGVGASWKQFGVDLSLVNGLMKPIDDDSDDGYARNVVLSLRYNF